jgi:excisionase family DNA binding protein
MVGDDRVRWWQFRDWRGKRQAPGTEEMITVVSSCPGAAVISRASHAREKIMEHPPGSTPPAAADLPPSAIDPLSLPPVFPVQVASRVLKIGRNLTYALIDQGEYPVRVLRIGNRYRVSKADLLQFLGYDISAGGDAA